MVITDEVDKTPKQIRNEAAEAIQQKEEQYQRAMEVTSLLISGKTLSIDELTSYDQLQVGDSFHTKIPNEGGYESAKVTEVGEGYINYIKDAKYPQNEKRVGIISGDGIETIFRFLKPEDGEPGTTYVLAGKRLIETWERMANR